MVHSTLYTFSLSNGHNEIQLTHSLQNCVGITLLGYESVSKNILVHFEDLPISAECYFDNVIHTRTIYLPNSASLPLAGPVSWRFDHPQVFPNVFRCNISDADAPGTPLSGLNSTNSVTLILMVECSDY